MSLVSGLEKFVAVIVLLQLAFAFKNIYDLFLPFGLSQDDPGVDPLWPREAFTGPNAETHPLRIVIWEHATQGVAKNPQILYENLSWVAPAAPASETFRFNVSGRPLRKAARKGLMLVLSVLISKNDTSLREALNAPVSKSSAFHTVHMSTLLFQNMESAPSVLTYRTDYLCNLVDYFLPLPLMGVSQDIVSYIRVVPSPRTELFHEAVLAALPVDAEPPPKRTLLDFLPIAGIHEDATPSASIHRVDALPDGPVTFTVTLETTSLGAFRLRRKLASGLATVSSVLGGTMQQDIDAMRDAIFRTSHWLLLLAVVVSLLHLILDFSAIRSDISFWMSSPNLQGLSRTAIDFDAASNAFITFYLYTKAASLLLLVPYCLWSAVGLMKCLLMRGVAIPFISPMPTPVSVPATPTKGKKRPPAAAAAAAVSPNLIAADPVKDQADALGLRLCSAIAAPVAVICTIYRFVYYPEEQINTNIMEGLAAFVYGAGFMLMFPQVIVNHKKKSVEALPWKVLATKAVNTFIDDIFALLLPGPMLHRVATLRDDVVFIIFLIQWYIYRDTTGKPVAKRD